MPTIWEKIIKIASLLSHKKKADPVITEKSMISDTPSQQTIELGKKPAEVESEEIKKKEDEKEVKESPSVKVTGDTKLDDEAFEYFCNLLAEGKKVDEASKLTEQAFYQRKKSSIWNKFIEEIKYGSRKWIKDISIPVGCVMINTDDGDKLYPDNEDLSSRISGLYVKGLKVSSVRCSKDEPEWFTKLAQLETVPFEDFWILGAVPGQKSDLFNDYWRFIQKFMPFLNTEVLKLDTEELLKHGLHRGLKDLYDLWRSESKLLFHTDKEITKPEVDISKPEVDISKPPEIVPDIGKEEFASVQVRSRLVKKKNKNTDKTEWALVSRNDPSKVLKWFGPSKPSTEEVQKEEKRVQFFKHKGSIFTSADMVEILNAIEMIIADYHRGVKTIASTLTEIKKILDWRLQGTEEISTVRKLLRSANYFLTDKIILGNKVKVDDVQYTVTDVYPDCILATDGNDIYSLDILDIGEVLC